MTLQALRRKEEEEETSSSLQKKLSLGKEPSEREKIRAAAIKMILTTDKRF